MNRKHTLILASLLLAAPWLQAATNYVSTTGNDTRGTGAYTNAYKTIQRAVDASNAGDLILVMPGVYSNSAPAALSGIGKSSVVITKNVTVRSTHGAERTIIEGRRHSDLSDYGNNCVRCVYMTDGVLDGFTLRNGYADASSLPLFQPTASILNGGGVCVPNGTRGPKIDNCIITGCSAYRGGGVHWGTLSNCSIYSNRVNTANSGGGVWSSVVRNSIVMFNTGGNFSTPSTTLDQSTFEFSCITPLPGNATGTGSTFIRNLRGNITADPKFVKGSCDLALGSPCINSGTNFYARGSMDAAGLARITDGIVDIGAYEANFKPYTLTVVDGTGSGSYTNGVEVAIKAMDWQLPWVTFSCWTGDTNTVADTTQEATTLVMPRTNITVVANYQSPPIAEVIGGTLNLPQPITTSNVTVFSVSPDGPSVTLGPVADGDVAFFETVYTNAGTVVFSWNVSSEAGWDFLNFYVDGVLKAQISGEVSGVVTQFVANVGSGLTNESHRLRWEYSKDSYVGSWDGDDRGVVGPITWIPDDLAAELCVPGPLPPPAFMDSGAPLPFPYGFEACFLDRSAPTGAVNRSAVRLGGLTNGVPLVADGQSTAVESLINGAGTLSFRCYTACRTGDKLVCTVDGVERFSMTGDMTRYGAGGWTNVVIELPTSSPHTVRWTYVKDGTEIKAPDAVWIDGATWEMKTNTVCQLTVVNGTGSGVYTNGDVVAITATDWQLPWVTFIGWIGDTNTVADTTKRETTLVMPTRDTTVIANYQSPPIDQIISEVLNIPLPIATSNVTIFSVNPVVPSVTLGPLADGDMAFFETVYTNAGTVVFSWNVSSEEGWDFLNFYVDGLLTAQISGEVSGVVTQFVANAGPHVLKWEYSKDTWPGSWAGNDQGEVGPITWIPDDLATELGVPGPLPPPTFEQPGDPLPFPYGFAACFLDRNPPTNAVGDMAVRLGGLNGTSPLVPDGESMAVQVMLNGAGTLYFRCFTACQSGDKIVCTVDGVEKFSMTGDKSRLGAAGWTNVVIEMFTPTAHVVRWSYIKDSNGWVAKDAAWVDSVTWERKTCTLTVQEGSGSGSYLVGDIVTIIGTNVSPLQVFEKWTGDIATVTDVNSMTTTIYMASDLVVRANYKKKYVLTVNGGTGSGAYFSGQVIPVVATNMVPGMVFDAWTGDTEYLADARRGDTTLLMPDRNISITSLLKIEPYLVSVVNGWDAGSWPNDAHEGFGEPQGVYPPDAEVRIVADPAPLWKVFSGWTWTNSLSPVTITDPTVDVSSFIMPSNSVTLIASYRDQTDAEKLAEALTIRGQPLVVTDFSTNGVVALSSGGVRYNDPVVKFGGPSVGRNESVSLTTPSFTNNGILRLWWRGDAEATRDGIQVEVNGIPITAFYSEKNTNTADKVVWWLSSWEVFGANTITIRYSRDNSYLVNDNFVLVDRVTWIPWEVVDHLDTDYIPNINQESDVCFFGHPKDETVLHDFSGEDGAFKWDATENAIKLGCFGYQTNNQISQVTFRPEYDPYRTCIYIWEWKSESEAEYDKLEFLLDLVPTNGVPIGSTMSGKDNVWTPGMFVLKSFYDRKTDLPQSPIKEEKVTWPVFTFRYTKDSSQSFLRDSVWVRNMSRLLTYGLYIGGGAVTNLVFPSAQLAANPIVAAEAARGFIPAGTRVWIAAAPAPSGMVFSAWSGELGGVVNPGAEAQDFIMPEEDIVLFVNYTAAGDPVAMDVKPQIRSFTVGDVVVKPAQTGMFTTMAAATAKSIGLTFEGGSVANYVIEWSPSLSGEECVWRPLPFDSISMVGSTPDGLTIWKVGATAPTDSQQGFFRLKRKE